MERPIVPIMDRDVNRVQKAAGSGYTSVVLNRDRVRGSEFGDAGVTAGRVGTSRYRRSVAARVHYFRRFEGKPIRDLWLFSQTATRRRRRAVRVRWWIWLGDTGYGLGEQGLGSVADL
jgi:hypothetical protein